MDLPEEDVEFAIMMMERFGNGNHRGRGEREMDLEFPSLDELKRKVLPPWWTLSLINKFVRQSRVCRRLDRTATT